MTLTTADLTAALADPRHLGYGLKGTGSDNTATRNLMADSIVEKANELGLSYEELFAWTNSKHARWAAEDARYNATPVEVSVDTYLTRATVRDSLR